MSDQLLEEIGNIAIPGGIKEIFSLDDYVAVVTGGASGLGEAIALGLAAFGSDIVLLDVDGLGLERVKGRVKAFGVNCDSLVVDVADWDAVVDARDKTKAKHGKVDVLVNCAGINIRKHVLDLQPAEFRKIVDVNLTGTSNNR